VHFEDWSATSETVVVVAVVAVAAGRKLLGSPGAIGAADSAACQPFETQGLFVLDTRVAGPVEVAEDEELLERSLAWSPAADGTTEVFAVVAVGALVSVPKAVVVVVVVVAVVGQDHLQLWV
jgi:hypothetical protein